MEWDVTDTNAEENVLILEHKSLRPFKSKDEYLYAMKEDLADWFFCLYKLKINVFNFFEVLETGVTMCQHANHVQKFIKDAASNGQSLCKDFIRIYNIPIDSDIPFFAWAKPQTFQARDNLSNFIFWCRGLGIPQVLLFETDDLVLRKNERSVVLCLLEMARVGAKMGMLAPTLVQMEEEIEAEIEGRADPPIQIQTCDLRSLDEMVRDLISRCNCPLQFPIVKISEGRYKVGESESLIFVRILRKHVMVRIGGGWDTLEHYLDKHDPCRCLHFGHRVPNKSDGQTQRSSTPNRQKSPNTYQNNTCLKTVNENKNNNQKQTVTSKTKSTYQSDKKQTETKSDYYKTRYSAISDHSKQETVRCKSANSTKKEQKSTICPVVNTSRKMEIARTITDTDFTADYFDKPTNINCDNSTYGFNKISSFKNTPILSPHEHENYSQNVPVQKPFDSTGLSNKHEMDETGKINMEKITTMSLDQFKLLLNTALNVPTPNGLNGNQSDVTKLKETSESVSCTLNPDHQPKQTREQNLSASNVNKMETSVITNNCRPRSQSRPRSAKVNGLCETDNKTPTGIPQPATIPRPSAIPRPLSAKLRSKSVDRILDKQHLSAKPDEVNVVPPERNIRGRSLTPGRNLQEKEKSRQYTPGQIPCPNLPQSIPAVKSTTKQIYKRSQSVSSELKHFANAEPITPAKGTKPIPNKRRQSASNVESTSNRRPSQDSNSLVVQKTKTNVTNNHQNLSNTSQITLNERGRSQIKHIPNNRPRSAGPKFHEKTTDKELAIVVKRTEKGRHSIDIGDSSAKTRSQNQGTIKHNKTNYIISERTTKFTTNSQLSQDINKQNNIPNEPKKSKNAKLNRPASAKIGTTINDHQNYLKADGHATKKSKDTSFTERYVAQHYGRQDNSTKSRKHTPSYNRRCITPNSLQMDDELESRSLEEIQEALGLKRNSQRTLPPPVEHVNSDEALYKRMEVLFERYRQKELLKSVKAADDRINGTDNSEDSETAYTAEDEASLDSSSYKKSDDELDDDTLPQNSNGISKVGINDSFKENCVSSGNINQNKSSKVCNNLNVETKRKVLSGTNQTDNENKRFLDGVKKFNTQMTSLSVADIDKNQSFESGLGLDTSTENQGIKTPVFSDESEPSSCGMGRQDSLGSLSDTSHSSSTSGCRSETPIPKVNKPLITGRSTFLAKNEKTSPGLQAKLVRSVSEESGSGSSSSSKHNRLHVATSSMDEDSTYF